jgi:MFS family permease
MNLTSPETLYNWVGRVDGLDCATNIIKSLIGMVWFIGWVLALLIIPRIADLFGRKQVYMISMVCGTVVYGAVLLCTNVYFMIVLFFLSGIFVGIRMSMGYVYMMEFVP